MNNRHDGNLRKPIGQMDDDDDDDDDDFTTIDFYPCISTITNLWPTLVREINDIQMIFEKKMC